MPLELTIIAVTALLAGLLLVGVMLAGRPQRPAEASRHDAVAPVDGHAEAAEGSAADLTLRVVWWLTITIVLLGVGISGSFEGDRAPIFLVGGGAVLSVVVFHELPGRGRRGRLARVVEAIAAVALVGGLLALTGHASSPFVMLFALVAVAAALAYGPGAGLMVAGMATIAFGVVLVVDPALQAYGPADGLRLSIGLGATWLLAFVAIAYAAHQRRAVAHAMALSRTDPLTGLSNRSQLFSTLEQEVRRTRRSERGFCLLMIDLDGLKEINDTTGHHAGDDVLRAIGGVIHRSIRTVDSAYRYGGDEFVVLLPETDIVGAFVVAEKIRTGAEEVGMALAGPITSVSIGLVSHPEDGMGAEELMIAADRAMYQAKKLGKNQISGNPRPRPALLARRSVLDAAPASPQTDQAREARGPRNGAGAPPEDRAVAVELGPVLVAEPPRSMRAETEEDEADAQVVRRQIAAASRSFDPDHQIRRAMDAFLSPGAGEAERPGSDH